MRTGRLELDVDGARTEVPELVGRPQPDLLLVNDDDLAYAKIRLDERSLATAVAHLARSPTSLPRALVLGAAWDMTRDAEMPGARLRRAGAAASLPGETDSTVLRTLLGPAAARRSRMYVAPQHREAVAGRASPTGCASWPRAAEPGSDAQLQLVTRVRRLRAAPADTAYAARPAGRRARARRGWPSTPRCAGRC